MRLRGAVKWCGRLWCGMLPHAQLAAGASSLSYAFQKVVLMYEPRASRAVRIKQRARVLSAYIAHAEFKETLLVAFALLCSD